MPSNNFNKQLLTRHIESECERQLFLDLAQAFPQYWYTDRRNIKYTKFRRKKSDYLTFLGNLYEDRVYDTIRKFQNAKYNKGRFSVIDKTYINPSVFLDLYDELMSSPLMDLLLLEYQFETPESFFHDIFPPRNNTNEIPVNFSEQRPDIIVIRKLNNDHDQSSFEFKDDGTIRKIEKSEYETRFAINIIDIKNVREDHIGKKQFLEIFYYMWTLAFYLKEHNLDSKFFIKVDSNGIFPQYETNELRIITKVEDIFSYIIEIKWEESYQIFVDLISSIKSLWLSCPRSIESVPLNIQSSCGYCYYLEDCKTVLGMDGSCKPDDWSIKLLPYTSSSIAQQLEEKGFETIGDILANIDTVKIGDIPEPLYSELPLLKLKARAIVYNDIARPPVGHTHTYSIPRFSPISITFAVETDPANERVYAVAFYLNISVPSGVSYIGIFDNWWKIWKNARENNTKPVDIQNNLNQHLIRKISLRNTEYFLSLLFQLKDKFLILLKGEPTKSGSSRKRTQIIYQYSTVNEGHSNETEAKLTKNIIETLYQLFELCNIIENHIVVEGFKEGTYFGPRTSLFYWASRQLINFQNMLERNLQYITNDPIVWGHFISIISLFTPSDSEVTHPYQHKKLFNLQAFVETLLGYPSVINYTWHEIAFKLLKHKFPSNRRFWIPHFNYMDFNNWYEMVSESNTQERKKLRNEIKRQMMHKVRTIEELRRKFQIESKTAISKHSRSISEQEIKNIFLPQEFHSLAQVWYVFSKLTGSRDQMDAEYYRVMYPEYSIGKLMAAKASNLKLHKNRFGKYYYTSEIRNLSSNIKMNVGDRMLLIPNEKRDILVGKFPNPWEIMIDKMIWRKEINGYYIRSVETNVNFFDKIKGDEDISTEPQDLIWYLYPTTVDVWSKKLYNPNGLLNRQNLGNSWLGHWLAFKWKIRSKQDLRWPDSWVFNSHAIYMYAPNLLISRALKSKPQEDLLTPIFPSPDPSQKKAIILALNNVFFGIQGPPGTGKSQTIAALIDEYYHRSILKGKKNVKILITAFSYAAIRVLIEKIRIGRDKFGNPTKTSQLQMIFLRSPEQKPIESKEGLRDVDDLVKFGQTWKLNGQTRSVTSTHLLEESLESSYIIFANAHQLYYLPERTNTDFAFDLICVDEASQLPVDHFLSSVQFVYQQDIRLKKPNNADSPGKKVRNIDLIKSLEVLSTLKEEKLTSVVIVGDYNQLPPVQPVPPPKNLEKVLESVFAYYVKYHEIPNSQLEVNYRSHKDIVGFTSFLGIYKNLKASSQSAERVIKGNVNEISRPWIKEVLDPQKVVVTLIHNRKFEIGVSLIEAEIAVRLLLAYYSMNKPTNVDSEKAFWKKKVGVVAPHNAQGRLIIRRVFNELTTDQKNLSKIRTTELMNLLKQAIVSVEKFQGSDRDLIISSIGISDKDQLTAECEFIYNLNRFNVLTSRAKSKVILIASDYFLKFVPKDRKEMYDAAQIRKFAYKYCDTTQTLSIESEEYKTENIEMRYKKSI